MSGLLTQTTGPAAEPLTRAEAKAYLKVDSDDENDLVDSLIVAARQMAEAYTARQLITATYTQVYDDFPDLYGPICLARSPLGAVSSIAYTDTNGDAQTLATSVYETQTSDVGAEIVLKPSQVWPSVQSDKRGAVTVTYTAGYGSASTDVPESARTGMLLLIGDLYNNRGDEDINSHRTARALLDTVGVRGVA